MKSFALCFVTIWLGFFAGLTRAENKVDIGHSTYGVGVTFPSVPAHATNDAATAAKFRLVDGDRDPNGGDLAVLHDGRVPSHDDQPAANFFFRAGIDGGRILIDLGKVRGDAGETALWKRCPNLSKKDDPSLLKASSKRTKSGDQAS